VRRGTELTDQHVNADTGKISAIIIKLVEYLDHGNTLNLKGSEDGV
jgi:hypothetical protein